MRDDEDDDVRTTEDGREVQFPCPRDHGRPTRVITRKGALSLVLGNLAILLGFVWWVTTTVVDQRGAATVRAHNQDADAHNAKLKEFAVAASAERQSAELAQKLDRMDMRFSSLASDVSEIKGELKQMRRVK